MLQYRKFIKELSMPSQRLAVSITEEQRKWLELENGRTKESFTSIIRNLIQDKANKEAKKK